MQSSDVNFHSLADSHTHGFPCFLQSLICNTCFCHGCRLLFASHLTVNSFIFYLSSNSLAYFSLFHTPDDSNLYQTFENGSVGTWLFTGNTLRAESQPCI